MHAPTTRSLRWVTEHCLQTAMMLADQLLKQLVAPNEVSSGYM